MTTTDNQQENTPTSTTMIDDHFSPTTTVTGVFQTWTPWFLNQAPIDDSLSIRNKYDLSQVHCRVVPSWDEDVYAYHAYQHHHQSSFVDTDTVAIGPWDANRLLSVIRLYVV